MKVLWVRFYSDDWIVGTMNLNNREKGIYIQVCAGIWSTGGPIDIDYLKKICPGKGFKQGLAKLAELGKVTITGRFVSNSRAIRERFRADSETIRRRFNGAKGGRPKGLAKPGTMDVRATIETEVEVDDSFIKESISSPNGLSLAPLGLPSKLIRSLDEEFEEVWPLFPRRIGKGQAVRAYRTARKRASFDLLLQGVRRLAIECQTTEAKFIPHPATWLNGQRWLDEEAKPNGYDAKVSEQNSPTGPPPTLRELGLEG